MDDERSTPELPEAGPSQDWAIWTPPAGPARAEQLAPGGSPEQERRDPRRGRQLAAIAAGIVAAAAVGGVAGHVAWPQEVDQSPVAAPVQPQSPYGGASASPFDDDGGYSGSSGSQSTAATAKVGAKVSPALVNINTSLGYQDASAAGTGIVLSSDGTVLTNNHVIRGATRISATDVGNGRTYDATVVGYDRSHDVAVIKLTGASGLETASIGNSSTAAVGQSVVGIGNAGGRGGSPTLSAGTITALDRSITARDSSTGDAEDLTGLIATDADIQPGQSGGPLVSMDGKVLGVDTAASASYSFSQGSSHGYAIPINTAMGIVRQITSGHASATVHIGQTGFLGVQVQDSSSSIDGSTRATGVAVVGALSGSPAAQAGLGSGSSITSVDGVRVSSPRELTDLLGRRHPGDAVTVEWTGSDGQPHSSKIVLAKGPAA